MDQPTTDHGQLTREARGAQYWKSCGEKLHAELSGRHKPSVVRSILTILRGKLIYSRLNERQRGELEKLHRELRGEFEPGPLGAILAAAERAGKREQKKKHFTEANEGNKA